VDFEWIKVVDFFELSSLGRLSMSTVVLGTRTWAHKLRRRGMLACRRREPGGSFCRGGRPAWVAACSPLARFSSRTIISPPWLPCPRAPRVAPPKRSRPLLFLHYWSFHLMLNALSHVHAPLLHLLHMSPWISCKVYACCPPMLVLCMRSWWKLMKEHPNGACTINLN
jgi:hypothetical protein